MNKEGNNRPSSVNQIFDQNRTDHSKSTVILPDNKCPNGPKSPTAVTHTKWLK